MAEEDISKLCPNLLLYRASGAHNLPVMCHAFAVGADPNWVNVEDKNRVALHQAVISVGAFNYQLNLFYRLFDARIRK